MLGAVELKPSSLQIPINTILLTKNPLIWTSDNTIILTSQLKLFILELECQSQSSCIDLQLKRYALDTPETTNPYIPSGPDYLKIIKNDGTKMINELSLPQLTSACRRAEVASGYERMSKPSQISGDLCHNGYRKTAASHIYMSKNNGCLLCTVTYDHQLWILTKVSDSYKFIHNLSEIWNEYMKSDTKFPDEIQAYKCRNKLAKYVKLQCFYDFLWTPTYKDDNGFYSFVVIITGSNDIVTFNIPGYGNLNKEVHVQHCSALNFSNVSASYLHATVDLEGLLVLASSGGDINLYKVNFDHKDLIISLGSVKHICRAPITHVYLNQLKEQYYLLLVVRSNVLMAYVVNIENDSFTKTATTYECGKFCIKGIQALNRHTVYATLSTGVVVKYDFVTSSDFGSIKIEKEELFNSENVSLNGFAMSPNKCLWAIFQTISVPYDHLVIRTASSVHVFGVNKPETLYDFALNETTIPIQWKADVFENIRLYATRGLFNSLLTVLISEEINLESSNFLQNYLLLSRICSNTVSRKNRMKEFNILNDFSEKVQHRIVDNWIRDTLNVSVSTNGPNSRSAIVERYLNPLTSCNTEAASEVRRCMLCNRRQIEDDSTKYFCDLCTLRIEGPMLNENFLPYCLNCEVTYTAAFCLDANEKNCLYCNRALTSLKDIPPTTTTNDEPEQSCSTHFLATGI